MFIPVLQYDNLLTYENVFHFTTTKEGGVSTGFYDSLNLGDHVADDPVAVQQNIELLKEAYSLSSLIIPKQCHTATIKIIKTGQEDLSETDAVITNVPHLCIGVLTADCVPILLYDPIKKVAAAIHAGWKGLVKGIIENTLNTYKNEYGSLPENLEVAIGPCISKEQYEVGKDVWEQFQIMLNTTQFSEAVSLKEKDKAMCCVRTAAQFILENNGVKKLGVSDYCTFSAKNKFFSARRDGLKSGRFLSAIMLS